MKPLLKLLSRLRPVSTAITMIIRPCFKLPFSGSMEFRTELLEMDCTSAIRGLSKVPRLESCGETGRGADTELLSVVGTSSMADNNCDMIFLLSKSA
jgi:hypothetical protein